MSWWMHSNGIECPAVGCPVRIHPSQFMCRKDWRRVPDDLKKALRASKPGDERDDAELDIVEHLKGAA